MAFPSLESAPCPPFFIENIYETFVEVALNQSLSEDEYLTIAKNCNISPSTTTQVTSSTTDSPTVTSDSSTINPTTESSTTQVPTTIFISSILSEPTTVEIKSSTTVTSTSYTPESLSTTSLPSTTSQHNNSSSTEVEIPSTKSTVTVKSTSATLSSLSTTYTTSIPPLPSSSSTSTAATSSTTLRHSPTIALSSTLVHTSSSTSQSTNTVTVTSHPRPSVMTPPNSCNLVCGVIIGCLVSLFLAIGILAFTYLKWYQTRIRRRQKYRIHKHATHYKTQEPYANVMNGSLRSSWNSNSGLPLYKVHLRSFSDTSFVYTLEPLRVVSQIYLPDTAITDISKDRNYSRDRLVNRSNSPVVDHRHTPKPRLSQSRSLEGHNLSEANKASIYKRNARPTRKFVQRRNHKASHGRSRSMGNPYSLEEYESEPSFDSHEPASYDGPITFTPDYVSRPLPKISSEVRREMIEQARESRRDLNENQCRRRSRSHDPGLVTRGYMERQFSFDLDPDIPGFRPAGRYKKHNPRERKVSTASREFNIDNINRYASEVDNNFMSHQAYGHHSDRFWNRDNTRSSLRNRNKEQKVISSILKKNKPPNNRSRSDCSGEGLRNDTPAADVFTPSRHRSQSYGTTLSNTANTQRPNTIYFYQTRL